MSKPRKQRSKEGLIGQMDAQIWPADVRQDGWVKNGLKHGWYIEDVNVYPRKQAMYESELGALLRSHVLPGHVPPSPVLDEAHSVVTLGSCFARELRLFLSMSGVDARRFWIPSGLNNTFAILDFFSWCVVGEQTNRGFRYERSEAGDIREWLPEAERESYLQAFAAAGAFVFTIGLAEVWQDRQTGSVFWRGVPKEIFDADRHVFRLTSVDENAANLRRAIELVRAVNPHAPIVLTLSPVPLLATHRPISCLTADCVSKSVLRVALDQVMADATPGVYYWPSFEIVKWVGANLPWPAYGENGSARDVSRRLIAEIIDAFIEAFYTPAAVDNMRARRGSAEPVAEPSDE
jgi:hypothetical protein